ncbi:MAG: hypothetical protein GTO55_03405 [Armatimonadetes bacterium]|nr:hypothetical protein [Armatimonadota bacterium]NIM23322.1 hypothetical protein [Armatimonadota bacterium]NIM67186.1 hypothetical protein [Armatimonadota bacterium]NIM75713.1 hypothetical protein [Armatimonadota bacterium]NIN05375.1 hypothetical protein [Armatimonadota bacterium]
MRWLRLGVGIAVVVWLLAMARREALRRGRKGLAAVLPFIGGAVISFMLAVSPIDPRASNFFLLIALLLLAVAIGAALWRGFR